MEGACTVMELLIASNVELLAPLVVPTIAVFFVIEMALLVALVMTTVRDMWMKVKMK